MVAALWLLAFQGVAGAFDTLYYHESRARLPARRREAALELALHAGRDVFYVLVFGTLPWLAWQGWWAAVLAGILAAEIIITMADFVIEIRSRRSQGDVFGGERITHALMAILYGAMLAHLIPTILAWSKLPTALLVAPPDIPGVLSWALAGMAVGLALSAVRDTCAALGLPPRGWPWRLQDAHLPGDR